jgi:uncharacterized membrane protein YagU involved in acid resistance
MSPTHRTAYATLSGGLVAGSVDTFAAALIYQVSPIIILHAVASGLLGKASFQAGAGAAVLGLALQLGMSVIIAAIYVIAARRLAMLTQSWLMWGALYGVVVFIVMNYVVVPLSNVHPEFAFPHFTWPALIENLLAMVLFGLIVAFFNRHFTRA